MAFRKKEWERRRRKKKTLSFKQVAGLFVICKMRRWKSTEGQWSLGLLQGFVPQTSAPVLLGCPSAISFTLTKTGNSHWTEVPTWLRSFQTWPRWSLSKYFHPHSLTSSWRGENHLFAQLKKKSPKPNSRLFAHWNPHSRNSQEGMWFKSECPGYLSIFSMNLVNTNPERKLGCMPEHFRPIQIDSGTLTTTR